MLYMHYPHGRPTLDTNWITVFHAVARRGSFTAAAAALGYTQSAVSRHIAALETELGAVLFDRLPRGVVLTEQGRTLVVHTEAIVRRLDSARADLAAIRNLAAGRLRVGAFPTANAVLLSRTVAMFQAACPEVAFTLTEGSTQGLLERVQGGDLDLAVVSSYTPRPLRADHVVLNPLLEDPMLVAMPRAHPLGGRQRLRVTELANERWIAGSTVVEDTLISTARFQPEISFVVREWGGKLGFVAAGLGVTLVPYLAAAGARADIALASLHPDDAPVRQVYVATPDGVAPPAAAKPFLDCLNEQVAALRT
jgi:DNA-binding transcriptional LysR family regulator